MNCSICEHRQAQSRAHTSFPRWIYYNYKHFILNQVLYFLFWYVLQGWSFVLKIPLVQIHVFQFDLKWVLRWDHPLGTLSHEPNLCWTKRSIGSQGTWTKAFQFQERFLKIICFSFRYSRNRQKVEASKLHPRSSRCSNSFQWSQLEFDKSTFISQTYHIDTEQSRFVGKCLQKTNQRKIAQWNGFEPCQYKRYNLFEFCEL